MKIWWRGYIAFIRSTGMVPAEVMAQLSPETNIVRDLRLDSVAVMEFIMELEIEFDTIIPLNEIANIADDSRSCQHHRTKTRASVAAECFRSTSTSGTPTIAWRVDKRDPFNVTFDRVVSPTEARLGGRKVLLLGTNNYLGLTFDPDCIAQATAALQAEGTGTTGSRVANGTYSGHVGLERQIADFLGRREAMVFTTGYQANVRDAAGSGRKGRPSASGCRQPRQHL